MEISYDSIVVSSVETLKPTNIETAVYPGFPTDLQQPFMVLLTQASGKSEVEENIWENRFMQVPYLNKMGANIKVKGNVSIIEGKTDLRGNEVVATDLRAGACMVLAALTANGTTTIQDVGHILRGYENIVGKLKNVGVDIELIDE